MKTKRTLYECGQAKVKGKRIYCQKGYPLSQKSMDGTLDVERLAAGEPLAQTVCQSCPDFDRCGSPVNGGRGWQEQKRANSCGS